MIEIRDFVDPDDRESLRACIVSLQEHERLIDPRMPPGALMASDYLEFLLNSCSLWKGRLRLASVAGEVAGFVCVLTAVPQAAPDEPRDDHAYISDLFVHGRFRGRGIGRALLHEAETVARASGVELLRIGVLAGNDRPRQLYENHGFQEYQIQLVKQLR